MCCHFSVTTQRSTRRSLHRNHPEPKKRIHFLAVYEILATPAGRTAVQDRCSIKRTAIPRQPTQSHGGDGTTQPTGVAPLAL